MRLHCSNTVAALQCCACARLVVAPSRAPQCGCTESQPGAVLLQLSCAAGWQACCTAVPILLLFRRLPAALQLGADLLPSPTPHAARLQTVLPDGQVVWSGPVFLKGRYYSLGLTGGERLLGFLAVLWRFCLRT